MFIYTDIKTQKKRPMLMVPVMLCAGILVKLKSPEECNTGFLKQYLAYKVELVKYENKMLGFE